MVRQNLHIWLHLGIIIAWQIRPEEKLRKANLAFVSVNFNVNPPVCLLEWMCYAMCVCWYWYGSCTHIFPAFPNPIPPVAVTLLSLSQSFLPAFPPLFRLGWVIFIGNARTLLPVPTDIIFIKILIVCVCWPHSFPSLHSV